MYEMTLRGTPAQMGTEHGKALAEIGLQLPLLDTVVLATECEKLCIQHTPELVEEMRAFADASNIPYETLKTFTLTIQLQQTMPSCSVVAVMPERSANGKLMVGRNYDFSYKIGESATLYKTYPDNAHAHIGGSDIWIGREDGINDAGLFVAMSATFIQGVQPGLPFWFIVRHMLEHFTTVDEALAWIQSVPHSQSRNYMLADAKKAVVAEASLEGVFVREPQDGVLTMTNHPAHPELSPRVSFIPDDSQTRYNRLRMTSDQRVGLPEMQSALNDRASGVCAHGHFGDEGFGTLWSIIAYPEDCQLAIARGTGDNSGTMVYQDYTF